MMNFFVLMSKYDDIPSWACSDVIDFNSAENVNEILKQNGYTNPFYKPGTNVTMKIPRLLECILKT